MCRSEFHRRIDRLTTLRWNRRKRRPICRWRCHCRCVPKGKNGRCDRCLQFRAFTRACCRSSHVFSDILHLLISQWWIRDTVPRVEMGILHLEGVILMVVFLAAYYCRGILDCVGMVYGPRDESSYPTTTPGRKIEKRNWRR